MFRRQLIAYSTALLVALPGTAYTYYAVRPMAAEATHMAGYVTAGLWRRFGATHAGAPTRASVVVAVPLKSVVPVHRHVTVVRQVKSSAHRVHPATAAHRPSASVRKACSA